MAASGTVNPGDTATDVQYNNLRLDAISATASHDHSEGAGEGVKIKPQNLSGSPAAFTAGAIDVLVGGVASDADQKHTHPAIAAESNNGSGSRAAAATSGVETVSHGLAETPKKIIFAGGSNDNFSFSNGFVDDDRNGQCMRKRASQGTLAASSTAIDVQDAGAGWTGVISAWDATNFIINWTKVGGGAGIEFIWQAEA